MYSKQFLFLTAIICVALADDKKISIKVTPKHLLALRSVSKECAEKTGVEPEILTKVINWTFDADEPTKQYVYCLSVTAGYVAPDGTSDLSLMLQFELLKGTQEEYKNELMQCSKIRKQNKIDTVFEIGKCIHKSIKIVVIRPE